VIKRVAADLAEEARATDERRLVVLSGEATDPEVVNTAARVLEGAGIDPDRATAVGASAPERVERVPHSRAEGLLGTTQRAVVLDGRSRLEPNVLGRTVGTVDGGGLFVLLAPPLESWANRRDGFDETLAVPPFGLTDVTGQFRSRFVDTLRAHPGIAIVDAGEGVLRRDGLTDPAPAIGSDGIELPDGTAFPRGAYEACRTTDQAEALAALEALRGDGEAVVVEADRGRGKSSAAGLAAGSLAADGATVLVTAPEFRGASEVLARTDELLGTLGERAGRDRESAPRRIETDAGGAVFFEPPRRAVGGDTVQGVDAAIVDEAAALPVSILSAFLEAGAVAFTTTVHGYEGAGRGFSVRFRDRLAGSDFDVTDVSMAEPIRYAAGDPIEAWSFRALRLDAAPVPDGMVEAARPATVEYRWLEPAELRADEALLAETFGLLVLAHYRTEPNDLARLLDAPNLSVRALLHDGHVVSVALLAREGGLSPETRAHMYEGGRIRGNMLPDVLTGQLGDEDAAIPVGWRVVRIATHAAARARGLGSHLLDRIRQEATGQFDWLGASYGATPDLLSFWAESGYSTVHLSATRNATSGEHSALVLCPTSERGRALHDRHAGQFAGRIGDVLSDTLSDLDPDVVRGALRASDAAVDADLAPEAWRSVARMAHGPGLMDVDPRPFRALARKHLIDPADPDCLRAREERLLVAKVLQARGWEETAEELGYESRRQCARATGRTYQSLLECYGTEAARAERDRFSDGD